MRLATLAILALLPLGACSTVQEAVAGPDLTPVRYPAALVPQQQVILASANQPMPSQASANSLWRTGARAFFLDQRANRVGDIVTVQIEIDDRAQTSNSTSTNRSGGMQAGVPTFFGLESSLGRILPGAFDPANAISSSSSSNNSGSGSVSRAEKINLVIAAVVTAVLPNGNMMIQGTQEVRTNGEVRQLSVAGIIRPEDITSSNTIRHSQIAEARISYGGRGDISRVQRTPAGQAIVESFSPF
ncbi:flagellar basal body L-ring protein FlgH [Phenylobacterium sp.]|uniref:flagellar basal body L-ring protein FlgH n=1 Tax=Phenylobacterium sp. TaxID=1871053 RepID=UPI00272F086E|nr:flagellar basal body L-ring protein FlgH [Phenylobacterium sp.]MDP1875342.1 flagellar basal body L-ring protein FlgH [Phenylobacterium sp.]MDP3298498.1 flagellar basal body L-ring protein FlgH [Phenylobacterium sp.]MDP3491071.1 flagellar basal body L-ring protein FlgH [Phenylobacterium sp.]